MNDSLLALSLESGYWRLVRRTRFRDHPGFSKKKKHFEPEGHSAFALRWAAELTREEVREEIHRIYENSVTVLGTKRSKMERGEQFLDCPHFRFTIDVTQDGEDAGNILVTRSLSLKVSLASLPENFDTIFPEAPGELVLPFSGNAGLRELLEVLEEWETKLKGKLEESVNQQELILHLPDGYRVTVDVQARELRFSRSTVAGVVALAEALGRVRLLLE